MTNNTRLHSCYYYLIIMWSHLLLIHIMFNFFRGLLDTYIISLVSFVFTRSYRCTEKKRLKIADKYYCHLQFCDTI